MKPTRSDRTPEGLRFHAVPISRRSVLRGAVLAAGALLVPRFARVASAYELSPSARTAIDASSLIYVCPLLGDGKESSCHGEVWFVALDGDLMVVTASDRWKAKAIDKGLGQARLWVGDHGVWKKAGDAFKKSPSFVAKATLETNPTARAKSLAAFGAKYPDEWDKWGPRFRNGLEDRSRVLIRYSPSAA